MIPIDKIDEMAAFLRILSGVADEAVKDLRDNGKTGFPMEGWPTLIRGLGYSLDQLRKLATPSNPVHLLNENDLLVDSPSSDEKKKLDTAMKEAEPRPRYTKKKGV